MARKIHPIRSPIRRLNAEKYLLITLLSFAASVSLTRLFLYLTGYPQLGQGELHIAHLLWGGLLLFVAVLLPLIYANHWIFALSAFLAGSGIGLFIDEVGKFITQKNDYFFPAAAPIVYALFLITLLIYHLAHRQRPIDARTNLYFVLDQLEEVLDRDLSKTEKDQIQVRLNQIRKSNHRADLTGFVEALRQYMQSSNVEVVAQKPSTLEKIRLAWLDFENRKFNRRFHRMLLVIGLFMWGSWAILHASLSWYTSVNQYPLSGLSAEMINNHLELMKTGIGLVELRLGLEVLVGTILILSCVLLLVKKDYIAIQIGVVDLLFSLTVVYLMVFYTDQFSSIIYTAIQFVLLLALIRYRIRFLHF